jgi:excisionase family DNA binding protein
MSGRYPPLTARQLEVLRWLADGSPDRDWPDETYKNSARALQSRGLAEVTRRNKVWTASITERGQFYLRHHRYPPVVTSRAEVAGVPPRERSHPDAEPQPQATTARLMRQVANRKKPSSIVRSKREIRETYMRYKVVVTRVQVAERFVRAPSEEEAATKVQQEFDRPYGYFGSWKMTNSEIDVIEAEQTTVIGPTHLSADGPLLLSIQHAAKALGISYSTLYQMLNQGDIEHVVIGSRKYLSREKLHEFIERNTHKGYYAAR